MAGYAGQAVVDGVMEFARRNYEVDGWDYIVECYSDDELTRLIGDCKTVRGAICKVRRHIRPRAQYRAEIQAEAF